MVTISQALYEGAAILKKNGIESPRLDAEVIMAHVTGMSRLKIITEGTMELISRLNEDYKKLINLRSLGMPAAYIIGVKEFMGIDFKVGPGVLIPRGDTEICTQRAIEECSKQDRQVKVADVCCGSGAIGISIAKLSGNAFATLLDISDEAIESARENIILNGVEARTKLSKSDLLSSVSCDKFDIIVSNPPYIRSQIIESLQREVKDYEPHLALDGGDDGLLFYRRLTPQAAGCLKAGGTLIYEIGYDQANDVGDIMMRHGFKNIEIIKDLAGLDRCVVGVV